MDYGAGGEGEGEEDVENEEAVHNGKNRERARRKGWTFCPEGVADFMA
jgi:hypothetical protein